MSHTIPNTYSLVVRPRPQDSDRYVLATTSNHVSNDIEIEHNRFSQGEHNLDLAMMGREFDPLEDILSHPSAHEGMLNELIEMVDGLIAPRALAQHLSVSTTEAASLHLEQPESATGEEQLVPPGHSESLDRGHIMLCWLISSTKSDPFHILNIDPERNIWGAKVKITDRLTLKDLESTIADDMSRSGPQVWSKHSTSSAETGRTSNVSV